MSAKEPPHNGPEQEPSAKYAPEIAIGAPNSTAPFDQANFELFFCARFGVRDEMYKQLRQFLDTYSIRSNDVLGKASSYQNAGDNLQKFERAKLAVLVAQMSRLNRKWSGLVRLPRLSMSAVLGGKAPSSARKTANDEMLRYYLHQLKSGIPDSEQTTARPLLECSNQRHFEGGYFEFRTIEMSRHVADFITGRQRQLVVEQNKNNGWSDPREGFLFWPPHVSPDYRAHEVIAAARSAFVELLRLTTSDADKDMARVRLLKDFFLDSESAHWQEMYELYTAVQASVPEELGLIDLRLSRDQIRDAVAGAFRVSTSSLPDTLLEQAECLVWLHALRHDPFGPADTLPARQNHHRQMQQPHYLALAAAILFHLREKRTEARIVVAGETHPKIAVYPSFLRALEAAEVNLALGPKANTSRLTTVYQEMDTKALNYMVALFSLAANAEDHRSPFLRMDYLKAHARLKIERVALLAEIPQLLKPFRCVTAYDLMAPYMSALKESGANPFMRSGRSGEASIAT